MAADTYTTFTCPKCKAVIKTALPSVEASHPCPKNLGKVTYLKGTK